MEKQDSPVKDVDWKDLYRRLYAFTDHLLKSKEWFRGPRTSSYLKGKEVHDYVSEAIEKYLRNPEKYHSNRGHLINYLKFNVIRTLVGNDVRSSENTTTLDVFCNVDKTDDANYLDLILPILEVYFDEELDYDLIMSHIEDEVKNDKIVEELFLGVCCDGLSRREVVKEFEMSEKDYDNGIRRLNTILIKVAEKFNLKKEN